jgi:PAS domain S-box-containing protein
MMRMLMREALEQAGFAVAEAEDGEAGIAAFMRLAPQLVLLDVLMPNKNGFEVCAALRRTSGGERVPIVLVTGLEDIESIQHAYDIGATDFVTKPINWLILTHRLRYMLRASHAIEEVYRSKEALHKAHDELELRVKERTAELSLRDRAISSTSEGICITDPYQPDNPLIYVNSGFERLTGYTREEVLGRNCRFLQGPQTDALELEKLRMAIHEQSPCVVELLNYRKDGVPFWNRFAITPMRNTEGYVTHFIGVLSDITERKEIERLKDELVSTVSHELRTPLTSLRGFAELMLKRTFPPEKQAEFLRVIHGESLRLTELINDFLDLQRIETGRQTYDFETVSLTSFLQDILTVFDLENGTHRLHLEMPPGLPPVRLDTARGQQVVTNLLSNAIKFSPLGGVVTVGAQIEGDSVTVRVTDQGIGIPPEALPNLFSKFFRVNNKDTRSIGGTGLGLALAKEIIKAHGGRIWVESVLGKGSTFFFTLPVSDLGQIEGSSVPPVAAPEVSASHAWPSSSSEKLI